MTSRGNKDSVGYSCVIFCVKQAKMRSVGSNSFCVKVWAQVNINPSSMSVPELAVETTKARLYPNDTPNELRTIITQRASSFVEVVDVAVALGFFDLLLASLPAL